MASGGPNPTGVRKDGSPKNYLTLKTKVQVYDELRTMLEADPRNEDCVRYRNAMTEEVALKVLQEKIPDLTIKNLESIRKELFGKIARNHFPIKSSDTDRINDLEDRVELALLEIESLKRAHSALIKEFQLDAKDHHLQGDVRRA